ncbi:hypothetical protein LTR66_011819 [Elasticomyces elasticus]|nr:hypothetical protein LTR66_011819 [Elasticomyces elasticus]
MAASSALLKSILKTSVPSPNATVSPQSDRDKRNYETAIQHARLIQEQKDVEARNLAAIEELIDFPSGASEADAARFTALVTPFQPSDYDALIEERHAARVCGYSLCPNPLPPAVKKPAWRQNERKQSENYCSKLCATKALYVKVQLNEEPAWHRRAGCAPQIMLQEEAELRSVKARANSNAPTKDSSMVTNDGARTTLARERGEATTSLRPGLVLRDQILENTSLSIAKVPNDGGVNTRALHTTIEGYAPKLESNKPGFRSVENEDDEDRDWNL